MDLLHAAIVLYISTGISLFLYHLSTYTSMATVSRIIKGSKVKKEVTVRSDNAKFNMKLSIIWPIALCLLLLKKRKS